MTKKNKKDYSKEDAKYAELIIGNEMNNCSEEIWNIITKKYNFSAAMIYGVLESIKLTVANDIYTVSPEQPHICTDCKETIEKQIKDTPKKAKEAQVAMYT